MDMDTIINKFHSKLSFPTGSMNLCLPENPRASPGTSAHEVVSTATEDCEPSWKQTTTLCSKTYEVLKALKSQDDL